MIEFVGVSKVYKKGEVQALKEVSFVINQGDFISLVGKSGAGKTTLLSLLTLEQKPDKGKILIESQDITKVEKKDSFYLRRKIGVVYQDMKLLPGRTAFENISFAMEVGGVKNEIINRDVPRILELVGLSQKIDSFPYQLSGGEKQRVAIARALAHKPVLLLADEPTGNLDDENAWDIIKLLLKINEFGTTVLLATHASIFVNKIKRRVITLEEGAVVKDQKKGKYQL